MPQVSVVLRPLTWALVVSVNEPLAASGFGGHAGAAGGGLVAPRADESARGCVTYYPCDGSVPGREYTMKRALAVSTVVVLTSFGLASAASAEPNQPGQGESSTGRNEAGFGGGPHWPVLGGDSAPDPFDLFP